MAEIDQDIELSLGDDGETDTRRREKRYPTSAQVKVAADELLLKNISLSGGQIQGKELIDMIPNGKYTIAIIPEKESKVDEFEVEIISKWVKMHRSGTESGFIMVLPPGNNIVENYIDFLKEKIGAPEDWPPRHI